MSDDDVHPHEMSGIHEFDDEAIEALLSGTGAEINEDLAAAVDSVRAAYTSQPPVVGQELAVLIGDGWAAASSTRSSRRMRLPTALRRLAVATAALFALTGALGVANALPGPLQDAVASVGIGSPDNHGKAVSAVAKDPSLQGCEKGRAVSAVASGKVKDKPCPNSSSTTTTPSSTTVGDGTGTAAAGETDESDDAGAPGEHGKDVSGVAKDPSLQGCEKGRAVSGEASGKTNDKPCPTSTTTTTVAGAPDSESVVPPTAPGNSGAHGQDGATPKDDANNNGNGRPIGRANQTNGSPNDD